LPEECDKLLSTYDSVIQHAKKCERSDLYTIRTCPWLVRMEAPMDSRAYATHAGLHKRDP